MNQSCNHCRPYSAGTCRGSWTAPHCAACFLSVRRDTLQYMEKTAKPEIVPPEEWQLARAELLKAEKEATRALDALAARRRRLPMVKFENSYTFESPDGPKTLLDLF